MTSYTFLSQMPDRTPYSGTSGEQINRNVPIQALVVLERGERNTAEVVNGLDAFGKALPHVQCPAWDIDMTTQAMDLFEGFLGKIPFIHLQCRPDAEAVDVLHRVLKENGL